MNENIDLSISEADKNQIDDIFNKSRMVNKFKKHNSEATELKNRIHGFQSQNIEEVQFQIQ